ncbi:MAG: colanic acid biosynthesis acetyltransferase WcaF [Chromatiaceae bacterium]|nr:colanic acid biosynthesis acetyltransferase WcaF [Chromatiaceae bacterium]
MRLDGYSTRSFSRGHGLWVEALWLLGQALLLASWVPGSWQRRLILRAFGARIGRGVVIKPGVRVKFPWRLRIGDHSWIGERVWIDNLATVEIGSNCVISQNAYLCTGSHDWSVDSFDLVVKPIRIEDEVWVAARACVGPGVTIGRGVVLALGAVATRDLAPGWVYRGNPAVPLKPREARAASDARLGEVGEGREKHSR